MELNHTTCYRALRTRDPRFDGRFFTGVHSTGIYCRPICPARTPKSSNVDFYPCASAAEEAGFRPCRRCRPEAAPGTPAWLGTSTTVTRALRLIGEGALDHNGEIDALADRLGVTARHLRRLFDEHLGTSPVAIAQVRRVHFAKTLLDTSNMSITEVAFSSGFSSIRRFNAVFAKTFGRSPREVRERTASGAMSDAAKNLELRLSFREPYDFDAMLDFLAARAIPGVELVRDGHYLRTVCVDDETGVIEVWRDPNRSQLILRIPMSLSRHSLLVAERVRRVFDLAADSRVIEAQLGSDPLLRDIVKRFSGTRVPGAWDPFEVSVRAILGQQVSVKGATTLSGRLARAYGETIETEIDACCVVHPQPERLLRARGERIGLTRARAAALRSLARAVVRGDLHFDGAAGLDSSIDSLVKVQGIGPWTAHYIAMRACGEPDAFPSGDLILRRVAQQADPTLDNEARLVDRSAAWSPWRAYAAMMLWRDYDPAAYQAEKPPSDATAKTASHRNRNAASGLKSTGRNCTKEKPRKGRASS